MTREQEIKNIKLLAKFMGWQFVFEYPDDGKIGFGQRVQTSWDTLMPVCKKIIDMYFDRREDIFDGLKHCDIEATYKAVVKFLEFWYDDTQLKYIWYGEYEIQDQQLPWVDAPENKKAVEKLKLNSND